MALLALLFVSLTPAPTQAQDGDAESHYLQAIEFFNEGRYQEALDSFDRAIAVSPEAIFFCNRATVLMKLDEFQDALTSMETCLERFEATDPEAQTERDQIHAEVQALRLAVRGVAPSGRAVATSIATRPKDTGGGGGGGSDIVFIEPIEPPGPTASKLAPGPPPRSPGSASPVR